MGRNHSRRLRVLDDISDCSQTVTVSHHNTVPDLTEPRVSRAIVEKMVASTQNTGPRMLRPDGRIARNKDEEDKAGIRDADSSEVDPITPDAVPPVQPFVPEVRQIVYEHFDGSGREDGASSRV